jgi:integrase
MGLNWNLNNIDTTPLPVINSTWAAVCQLAGVDERTPQSARHGMGCRLANNTGTSEAVKDQLGHQNEMYSVQYLK